MKSNKEKTVESVEKLQKIGCFFTFYLHNIDLDLIDIKKNDCYNDGVW